MSEMLNELVPGQSPKDDTQLLQVCVLKVLFVIPNGTSGLVASSPTQHNNKQLKTHKNANNVILFVVESPL